MDFASGMPIYLQIAQNIREQILSGQLPAGSQTMSTTQYAAAYKINPATANKALNLLVDEGLLEKRRGVGMFVTARAEQLLRATGREEYAEKVLGPALDEGLNLGFTIAQILRFARAHFEAENTKHTEGEAL